jgi:hypothetical protein
MNEMSDSANSKKIAIDLIENLPNDVTLDDIQYHLFVIQKLQKADQQISSGETIPHDEVMEKLKKKWFP